MLGLLLRAGAREVTIPKSHYTIHHGEYLVASEIEKRFPHVNVWIPSKDTGVDLLVSSEDNKMTVTLQVKYSKDFLSADMDYEPFHEGLRACGWWTPTRQQIEKSRAEYWIFVLDRPANRGRDFIIIKPNDLLQRFDAIHGETAKKFQSYLWVTKTGMCWEARGLNSSEKAAIADNSYKNDARDFTAYLAGWAPIKALNDRD